jgi:hypothetical protein
VGNGPMTARTRLILALFLLTVAVTLLTMGMWQTPSVGLQSPAKAIGGGSKNLMSDAWIGVIGTLLGTVIGAALTYVLTWELKRREDQHKRQALASILLSEVKLLHLILKDLKQAYFSKALHKVAIEAFHTAMFDQMGTDHLLFKLETAPVLAQFYQLIHTLRTELNQFRDLPIEQRIGRDEPLWARIRYTAEMIEEVMHKLSAEGGVWPKDFPSRTYPWYPEDVEFPPFPPFPKPPRS